MHWAHETAPGGGGGLKHIRDRLRFYSNLFGVTNPAARAFFAPSEALERAANLA
jgi:hypothetical protein